MSIYHPTYLEFIKNEKKTLKHLMDSPSIRKEFPQIAAEAEKSYYNLPPQDKELAKANFNFKCRFNLLIERENKEVMALLEAQVGRDFSLSNYVLSLCENTSAPYKLIRKFHFDYINVKNNNDPKPVYHFQYGGQATPLLNKMKIDVNILRPWLSNPRFSFNPINLALLIDSIFSEFISEKTIKIINTSEWRDFVKENEDAILRPYYSSMNHFMNGNHSANFLIRDCLYGKQ